MATTMNEPKNVTLYTRKGDSLVRLNPTTSAKGVSYRNEENLFSGDTQQKALDELFRRIQSIESEVLPPVVAVPSILSPEANSVLELSDALSMSCTPFRMKTGKTIPWLLNGKF